MEKQTQAQIRPPPHPQRRIHHSRHRLFVEPSLSLRHPQAQNRAQQPQSTEEQCNGQQTKEEEEAAVVWRLTAFVGRCCCCALFIICWWLWLAAAALLSSAVLLMTALTNASVDCVCLRPVLLRHRTHSLCHHPLIEARMPAHIMNAPVRCSGAYSHDLRIEPRTSMLHQHQLTYRIQ